MTASNNLAGAASAYLRQHADQPVNWQIFADQAFAEAAARDVPVFLSIGYAACHWCHVMAAESFADTETARYLNEHFVPIKVDREERPDVDAAYLAATQALTGQGGWPMSVFLTPDGRAFHAGTYFPAEPMRGLPSFNQLIRAVTQAWDERREQLLQLAQQLTTALQSGPLALPQIPAGPEIPGMAEIQSNTPPLAAEAETGSLNNLSVACSAAVRALAEAEDPLNAGFGTAPKFPPSPVLEFLIRHAATDADTAAEARAVAARALAAMARSALRDQLAGGFARYSVSADWSTPHFEKMLYDNAALLGVYAHWLRLEDTAAFPRAEAAEVVRQTGGWLREELLLPGGAYASSLDADTVADGVHVEGGTYLWTAEEFCAAGGTSELAVLMRLGAEPKPLHPGAALSSAQQERWDTAKSQLRTARARRPQPARDNKVVAAWNGMLIGSLADAGAILAHQELVDQAQAAAQYLLTVHWDGARLTRISHEGRAAGIEGLLVDYAAVAHGLLALYAAGGERRWYQLANELLSAAEQRFVSARGVVDSVGESAQVLRAQGDAASADPLDEATGSGISLFAQALITASAYSGSTAQRRLAERLLAHVPAVAPRAPRAMGAGLAAGEALLAGPLQLVVCGTSAEADAMWRLAVDSASPGLVIARKTHDDAGDVPLLAGRNAGPNGARAYLCRGNVCHLPANDAETLAAQLAAATPSNLRPAGAPQQPSGTPQ